MYNKIFTKILDSSIWLAPDPHRLVWITLIAAMDRDGLAQFACAENVASRARVRVEDAIEALVSFEGPDPNSGDPQHDGRRIERVPGGWLVLNAEKYRGMVSQAVASEQAKLRMQAYRKRNRLRSVTEPLRPVTPSEADSDAEAVSEARKPRGEGAAKAAAPSRGTRLPKDFALTAEREAYARKHDLDPSRVYGMFTTYWWGKGATKIDWDSTWQHWCMKDAEKNVRPTRPAYKPPRSVAEMEADEEKKRGSR